MDKNLLAIAEAIYSAVSGADNRQEREMVNEIYDWLYNGDAQNLPMADVPALVSEWKEYGGLK